MVKKEFEYPDQISNIMEDKWEQKGWNKNDENQIG